jgi:WD40 repeat protein
VTLTLDGRRAVVSSGQELRVWDADSGECMRTLEAPRLEVDDVVLTPDGRVVVSADKGPLRAWDVEAGVCLWTRHAGVGVHTVCLSPDGRTAISAHDDNALRIWDVQSGACLRVLPGHTDRVRRIAFAPDGRTALSAGADSTLRTWDIVSGQCLHAPKRDGVWVRDAAMTPDGRIAISANRNGREGNNLCVWDLGSGALLRTLDGHSNEVRCVAVTPDGRRAVSASFDRTLRIWDVARGVCLATLQGHLGPVTGLALSCDGLAIASTSDDTTLRVWDLASGACLAVYPTADFVKPAGERIWEVGAPELRSIHVAGNQDVLSASAFTPNGRLACATDNGQMHFLTLRNLRGEPLVTAVRLFKLALAGLETPTGDGKAYPVFDERRPLPGYYEEAVTAGCPWCGNRFPVPAAVLHAIDGHNDGIAPSPPRFPCLDLPADAWTEPRLSSQCSHCRGRVRFNPFLVDNSEAGPSTGPHDH